MLLDNLKNNVKIKCESEYGQLCRVVMCPPTFLQIKDIINDVQKHYYKKNIDIEKALGQFNELFDFMKRKGIEIDLLPSDSSLPEQVFTRDIGAVINNSFIKSNMSTSVRCGEERILKEWLDNMKIPHNTLDSENIEGGDIIIDHKDLWVGIGNRTSPNAVQILENQFPSHHIHPINITDPYLHLDCIFNVIAPNIALVLPKAIESKNLQFLSTKYKLIDVSEEEHFHMGINVLSIGNREILSLPQNTKVNEKMRESGLQVYEIDISEIIKSGGSFRCITLPLNRED
ncbi:dimethylarginine dimethylaminohydrolase family protein [Chengkuizengella marina]|uniref:N-Dimethylarginine dimethylaminohydrolase n=1 Tax=Chengkuizengella marina TaxID=2507566 RepID=A0A6N9Q7D3_9BACL|nr:arginine deiminase family protein [Chengkuizengella marina]NBI30762.1 hypothetical protein [Chengkuizengella marina]